MNSHPIGDEPLEGDLADESLDRDRVMTGCVSVSQSPSQAISPTSPSTVTAS